MIKIREGLPADKAWELDEVHYRRSVDNDPNTVFLIFKTKDHDNRSIRNFLIDTRKVNNDHD